MDNFSYVKIFQQHKGTTKARPLNLWDTLILGPASLTSFWQYKDGLGPLH